MIDLPVISTKPTPGVPVRFARLKQWGLHLYRVAVLLVILWLIREHHLWQRAQQSRNFETALNVSEVKDFFPTAAKLTYFNPTHGGRYVANNKGELLGYVLQTSPEADSIIGYSGPTNLLIALDINDTVLGIKILSSADTPEHVQQIKEDSRFLKMFNRQTLKTIASQTKIDAVSGATLTSRAIAESVIFRLAGKQRPSYKFPDPVTLAQVSVFFAQAAKLEPSSLQFGLLAVRDETGKLLGQVMRTSPAADEKNGYQGPIDLLVALGTDGKVLGMSILKSYETEKYIETIKKDTFFMERFNGMTLSELAIFDETDEANNKKRKEKNIELEIEGTSGATMTSMTMAEGIFSSANQILKLKRPEKRTIKIQNRDIGILIIIMLAILISTTRLRGNQWVRILFQILLVVYVGFINADFVSQALLVGWVKSGVPWEVTPGLVLLVAASLALPLISRNQLYCNHICPFGAAQQLLVRLPFCKRSFPKLLSQLLKLIPGLLLCAILILLFLSPTFSLTSLEPFHAFLFQNAGYATLVIAITGLAISLFVPMAYCRYGCPTGVFLDYIRLSGERDKFNRRDGFALLMLAIAIGLWWGMQG